MTLRVLRVLRERRGDHAYLQRLLEEQCIRNVLLSALILERPSSSHLISRKWRRLLMIPYRLAAVATSQFPSLIPTRCVNEGHPNPLRQRGTSHPNPLRQRGASSFQSHITWLDLSNRRLFVFFVSFVVIMHFASVN